MPVPPVLRRANRGLDVALYWGVTLAAGLFFAVVLVGVTTRYVLKTPILASIELSRLFFVWSCFLAAAITYRRRAHVGFTLLYEKFGPRAQRLVTRLIFSAILLFSLLMLVHGVAVAQLLWLTDLPMLGWSQSWFYVPVPLVGLIFILYTLEFLFET